MESTATMRIAKTFHLNLYCQAEKFNCQTASNFQQLVFFQMSRQRFKKVLGLLAYPNGFKMAIFFSKNYKNRLIAGGSICNPNTSSVVYETQTNFSSPSFCLSVAKPWLRACQHRTVDFIN